MADYREISQQYAQGGIKACIVLNSGAAIVTIGQASDLIQISSIIYLRNSILLWVIGTGLAAISWVFAFAATRYVDKSERETQLTTKHLQSSDRYMALGLITVLLSIALFLAGCSVLAFGLRVTP